MSTQTTYRFMINPQEKFQSARSIADMASNPSSPSSDLDTQYSGSLGTEALSIALIGPDELDDLILGELARSALFGARFRENAARALLIPRRRPGQRDNAVGADGYSADASSAVKKAKELIQRRRQLVTA